MLESGSSGEASEAPMSGVRGLDTESKGPGGLEKTLPAPAGPTDIRSDPSPAAVRPDPLEALTPGTVNRPESGRGTSSTPRLGAPTLRAPTAAYKLASTETEIVSREAPTSGSYSWERGPAGPFSQSSSNRCLAPSTVPPAAGRIRWRQQLASGCDAPVLGSDGVAFCTHGQGAAKRALSVLDCRGGSRQFGDAVRPGCELVVTAAGELLTSQADGGALLLAPSGSVRWASSGLRKVDCLAADGHGRLYVISNGGHLTALSIDGKHLWQLKPRPGERFTRLAVSAPGRVYATTARRLYALEDGHALWNIEGGDDRTPPALGADGRVYWLRATPSRAEIAGASASGHVFWRLPLCGDKVAGSLVVGANGHIYTWCADRRIRVYAAGVHERTLDPRASARPVVALDGSLYVPGADGLLYAIDRKGELRWSVRVDDSEPCNSPAIAGDGAVYVTSTSGKVCVVE
jgi:outer membrane protein assembly factor BamB